MRVSRRCPASAIGCRASSTPIPTHAWWCSKISAMAATSRRSTRAPCCRTTTAAPWWTIWCVCSESSCRRTGGVFLPTGTCRAQPRAHLSFPARRDNGLALDEITPGLQPIADELERDGPSRPDVAALGSRYLEDGDTLVHGDYFPGSWVRAPGGVAVIDPEFCFLGGGEHDLGVMMAHLIMAGDTADVLERVTAEGRANPGLARQFAGVEIMRRLIGVAQLPLTASLERKRELLGRAKQLVLAS